MTREIIEYSKDVLRSYKKYCLAPKTTRKTEDIRYMRKAEEDFLKSVVGFAMFLQKRSLGSPVDLSSDQGVEE